MRATRGVVQSSQCRRMGSEGTYECKVMRLPKYVQTRSAVIRKTYKGASLIENYRLLGTFGKPMPRGPHGGLWGVAVSKERGTHVWGSSASVGFECEWYINIFSQIRTCTVPRVVLCSLD